MQKHIETILTAAGVTPEDIAIIDAVPEADQAGFDSKPYIDKVRTNYRTQLQNDPAFFSDITLEKLPATIKKQLETNQYGRAAHVVRDKVLKGLGMTEADLADLTDEQRTQIELFIPAVTEKYTKTKAGDKQLQADLIDARKKLESFSGMEETYKTKYEGESNSKISAAIFNAALIGELSAIQGLKIPAGDIAATANQILQSKYGFERVGDYSVELRQKANPQMKVLKDGSSHELTLKDALSEIAAERGWVDKKVDNEIGFGKVEVKPDGKGQLAMVAPHLQAQISSKIAAEK